MFSTFKNKLHQNPRKIKPTEVKKNRISQKKNGNLNFKIFYYASLQYTALHYSSTITFYTYPLPFCAILFKWFVILSAIVLHSFWVNLLQYFYVSRAVLRNPFNIFNTKVSILINQSFEKKRETWRFLKPNN